MKICILFLFYLSSFISFSQNYNNIHFNEEVVNTLPIYKKLGIVDSTSLLINIGMYGGIPPQNQSYIIAYHPNRKIDIFSVQDKYSNGHIMHTITKKIEISRGKRKLFRSFLKLNIKHNNFNMDTSQLNIQEIDKEGEESEMMELSDGTTYFIQVIKNNQFSTYSSYSPYEYILGNYPGSGERQKLLNIYEGYLNLVSPYFK